ncbi:MAG TPA: hypothetical protein VFS55_02185, partial [Dokdonella sp.]|nr:hypothetical protein [Dokdonella sp.]
DEAMLRGRALAFAASVVEGGARATQPACADVLAVADAFAHTPHSAGADAQFASYLAALCGQGHASPAGLAAHYARIAERVRDAWDRHDARGG